jgi:hypothetical protein
LNDIDRIARKDYEPSNNDVVRARLRTLGVQQYNFHVEQMGHEWQIFDVGGARSLVRPLTFLPRTPAYVLTLAHGVVSVLRRRERSHLSRAN